MLPTTKPDKKVPTHGPGTTAWYRGKEAKILAIENGKAKIFCDGRVLLVNYTSLDDVSFKTLHEAYRVVDCDSHKALYIGTKDECESFISDECQDKETKIVELKEAIMVPSDGMNPRYTLQTALSYANGNAAAMIASNPLLYGISVLQRKYVVVCNVLGDEGTENPAYKKLDKEVRAKYHKLLSIPGESGKKYEVFGNKDNTSFLLYYEDAFTTNWFVPAAGKINESMAIKENVLDQKNIVANLSTGTTDTFQKVIDKHPRLTLDPLFYGVASLCYKWRRLAVFDDWFEINDEIRKKYDIRFTFSAGRNAKIYLFAKKISSTVVAIKYESPESGAQWYLPANGKLNEWVVINESEAQDKYQEFFKKKLADYGVSSPAELSTEDKSKFFSEIEKEWPDAKVNESSKKEIVIKAPETYGSITKGTPIKVFAVNDKKVEASGQKRFLLYTIDGKRTELIVVDKNDKVFNTLNEAEMAFGIGSTVNYNGKTCKVVSIANGKCKLVCGGEVLYANMDELQPSNPINEAVRNL